MGPVDGKSGQVIQGYKANGVTHEGEHCVASVPEGRWDSGKRMGGADEAGTHDELHPELH